MRIKPGPGLKVLDHATRQWLPADGIDVPDTGGVPTDPYWQFLLRHGDVQAVEDSKAAEAEHDKS